MLKEQTLQSKNIKNVGGKYRFVNHEASIVTEGYDTVVDLALAARRIPFDFGSVLQMRMKYQELYGSAIDWSKFVRSDTPAPLEPANPDDEQARLNLKYWGEVVPAVAAYNKENNCDVKPWDCVLFEDDRKVFDTHPRFDCTGLGAYGFYVAILYNEETKTHEPVFVGDKLYNKDGDALIVEPNGARSIFADGVTKEFVGAEVMHRYLTWAPPTPKREFEFNGQKFACPEKGNGYKYRLQIYGEMFYFKKAADRNNLAEALRKILRDARDE